MPQTVDQAVSVDIDVSKQPATIPFHRTYVGEDRYSLVVNTRPLLRNVPDPGKAPIRAMSLKDLKSSSTSSANYAIQLVNMARYQPQPLYRALPKCANV